VPAAPLSSRAPSHGVAILLYGRRHSLDAATNPHGHELQEKHSARTGRIEWPSARLSERFTVHRATSARTPASTTTGLLMIERWSAHDGPGTSRYVGNPHASGDARNRAVFFAVLVGAVVQIFAQNMRPRRQCNGESEACEMSEGLQRAGQRYRHSIF